MNMKKLMKKVLAGAGTAALLFGVVPASQIEAYSYNHMFEPPFVGCACKEKPQDKTASPYVSPSVTATNTSYCLVPQTNIEVASNFVKTGSTGRYSFTYKTDYYNTYKKFRLKYYPTSARFSTYNVYGKWQS